MSARRAPPGFLKNVRWSTANALADSVATLGGRRIGLIDTLDDIDTEEDLLRAKVAGADQSR